MEMTVIEDCKRAREENVIAYNNFKDIFLNKKDIYIYISIKFMLKIKHVKKLSLTGIL